MALREVGAHQRSDVIGPIDQNPMVVLLAIEFGAKKYQMIRNVLLNRIPTVE